MTAKHAEERALALKRSLNELGFGTLVTPLHSYATQGAPRGTWEVLVFAKPRTKFNPRGGLKGSMSYPEGGEKKYDGLVWIYPGGSIRIKEDRKPGSIRALLERFGLGGSVKP